MHTLCISSALEFHPSATQVQSTPAKKHAPCPRAHPSPVVALRGHPCMRKTYQGPEAVDAQVALAAAALTAGGGTRLSVPGAQPVETRREVGQVVAKVGRHTQGMKLSRRFDNARVLLLDADWMHCQAPCRGDSCAAAGSWLTWCCNQHRQEEACCSDVWDHHAGTHGLMAQHSTTTSWATRGSTGLPSNPLAAAQRSFT